MEQPESLECEISCAFFWARFIFLAGTIAWMMTVHEAYRQGSALNVNSKLTA